MNALNVQLLLTGNEIMSGDIVDSNSAMIAQQLKDIGIEVRRRVAVADDLTLLVDELIHLSKQADIVIVNGGLGPTVDDLTAQALAKAAQIPLAEHPQALAHLETWCQQRGIALSEPNLKQAVLPERCDLVANRLGSAVGFSLSLNHCLVICTPGVPRELAVMLSEQIIPQIKQLLPAQQQSKTTRLQVFGYGESTLQQVISQHCPDWPAALELGFRASHPMLEVKITSHRQIDKDLHQHWLERLIDLVGQHLVNIVEDKPVKLAQVVNNLLAEQQLKLTTAESCTGGLIASQITQIAGSSSVFEAGIVSYANNIKEKLLFVPEQVLTEFGAVSEQTVVAMAQGALVQSGADIAVAVSGIAGPGGGSEEKPVGTVWLAWGDNSEIKRVCLRIPGPRIQFQQRVSTIALDLVRRWLLKSNEMPIYIKERAINSK